MTTTRFIEADYNRPEHARDLVALLDAYAKDPMGGGEPLSAHARENLAATLAKTPNASSIIGYADETPVAVANCFVTLSTFACRPLVNVHDLAVMPECRGQGVGKGLLQAIETAARTRDACKITLEVLEGNAVARAAYENSGFRPYVLDEKMGTALFSQKLLA